MTTNRVGKYCAPGIGRNDVLLRPVDLRCEYLSNPMGVDVTVPRFSWKLMAVPGVRNEYQTVYQIRAAGQRAWLDCAKADLWDSGWVASPDSVHIPYGGTALVSHQFVHWQVRIKNRFGKVSDWSEAARFSMGLLSDADWLGPWIRHPDAPPEHHIWFRRNVQVESKVDEALIHVATQGYHELYMNGERVGDQVLAPAMSRLDRRVLYCTYDISRRLHMGQNTIAIWQGPGWARYEYFNLPPALRVQMLARFANGEKLALQSDSTWRCTLSCSQNTGHCKWSDNGGEQIDARRYIDDWHTQTFDDRDWVPAKPWPLDVQLSAQLVESTRALEKVTAQKIISAGKGYCVDMGKNFTGYFKVRMRGLAEGDKVMIQVANRGGVVEDFAQRSYFISAGDAEEVFQHRFNYAAGRYVYLTGLKSKPRLDDIEGHALSTDVRRTGAFVSSHPLLNQIYETDLWTWRANLVEGVTFDCPHRERLGYGEVAFACAWGVALPNYDSGALYSKHVRDWWDVQEKNGWIHHTAPHVNRHYGGPLWSSAGLNLAWCMYVRYGDQRLLESAYKPSKRWLAFLHTHVRDGLLRNYDSHWGRFLGDWAAPGPRNERGDSIAAEYFNNCVYALNLDYVSRIATVLGRTAEAALYKAQLATLRARIHTEYYDADHHQYAAGTQVQLAFALLAGVTPAPLRASVADRLLQTVREKGFLDMGSSGLPILFKYMVEEAENSEILMDCLTQKVEPSYGFFLAEGETTWPEYWSNREPSRIHTCFTGVSSWLTMGLAGIRPDPACPGFKSFWIKPVLPNGLSYVDGRTESQYGLIRSRWQRAEGKIQLAVNIPPNSTATVFLPVKSIEHLSESGRKIDSAEGVSVLRIEEGLAVMRVAAGEYCFVAVEATKASARGT